ncbi:MAG: L-threonylcarbamoyladenylate synthase [Deltaproteobacteria bacterium]|nr:L-threonylcarbamoyladenylate synthase [Candidatus Deferrimicrobiaceae bacterium]
MTRLARFDAGNVAFFPPGVVESLLAGGMVIYPTDTLYGLGVDPRSRESLEKLLVLKSREGGKPIPLLLDGPERVADWAEHVPPAAVRLMEAFWPGGVTIVLPAWADAPPQITGGSGTVGLRVPGHPIPRALARALGGAITGTSANRAGNPGDWQTAEEVVREFTGEVDWVLWDGPSPRAGVQAPGAARPPGSTVVRAGDDGIVLLREGAVPFREILHFLEKG